MHTGNDNRLRRPRTEQEKHKGHPRRTLFAVAIALGRIFAGWNGLALIYWFFSNGPLSGRVVVPLVFVFLGVLPIRCKFVGFVFTKQLCS